MIVAPTGSLGLVNVPQSSWFTVPQLLKVIEFLSNIPEAQIRLYNCSNGLSQKFIAFLIPFPM